MNPSPFAPIAAISSLMLLTACEGTSSPPGAKPAPAVPNAASSAAATSAAASSAVVAPQAAAPAGALPATFAESSGGTCPAPPLPPLAELRPVAALPDPFLSANGQRITKKAEWTCRRAEIADQVQEYEHGPKPPKPSVVTGTFAGDVLTVTAGEPGKTVQFAVPIARPPSAPSGVVPGLIVIGRSALSSLFAEHGVAVLTFDNGAMGAQGNKKEGDTYTNTRGQGLFYDLYGKDHPASSMMAWAWGVSRVIDALAATPEAGIDVRHLAVSGCSRNGKGALVVGAFDERIALTISQESGAGGAASWRVSQAQMDEYRATVNPNPTGGQGIQTLAHAAGEQPWFRASFSDFGKSAELVTRLPFDQHLVMGLVAPRALFVLDNTDMMWLGAESSITSAAAAGEIWKGLGAEQAFGASQVGGHPHCTEVPKDQLAELGKFIDKFLLDKNPESTHVLRSDKLQPNRERWVSWNTPTLL